MTRLFGVTLAIALQAVSASAHTYAPVQSFRTSTTHASTSTTRTNTYRGFITVGVPGQIAAADVAPDGQTVIVVYAPPSDATRYMAATGRILPERHGLITLPPATANGDFTYLWPTPSGN